jgi:hypothetical protein
VVWGRARACVRRSSWVERAAMCWLAARLECCRPPRKWDPKYVLRSYTGMEITKFLTRRSSLDLGSTQVEIKAH